MSDKININLDSIQIILKKLQNLQEESYFLLSEVDKNLSNAELEGWNDKRYYEFKDSFDDTKSFFNNGIKKIDEEHIPYLKKILRIAEEFN